MANSRAWTEKRVTLGLATDRLRPHFWTLGRLWGVICGLYAIVLSQVPNGEGPNAPRSFSGRVGRPPF